MQGILSAARAKKLDRVAAAYAVAGWLLVQAASIVLPTFGAPEWALRTLIAIALIGFPIVLFVAWHAVPHPYADDIPKLQGLTAGELTLMGLLGGVLLLSLAQLTYEFTIGARTPPASDRMEASSMSKPSADASAATDSLRVAVVPFDIIGPGTDATRAFADALLDKIDSALAANQVATVSRADSLALRGGPNVGAALADLRVGLTLEGSVQDNGNTITVRVHLDDVRQHQTLWSGEFNGPVDSSVPLQTQVALHATDVTRWAVSPRLKSIRSDPSLVAAYLEGEDEDMNGGGGRSLAIARDLVARAPGFAAAHILLSSAVGQENGLEVVTPEAHAESVREAKRAIALDSNDGQAYAMLAYDMPLLSFKEREDLLLKGLSVEPGNASANFDYAKQILAATGRTEEAITQARSAWHVAPFTEWVALCLPQTLVNAGRIDDARAALADMKRKWPDDSDVFFKSTEFIVESQQPPFTRALALLDNGDLRSFLERPPYGKPGAVNVLRTAMRARLGSAADRRTAVQLVDKAVDDATILPGTGISLLSSLGDVEGAFTAADRTITPEKLKHAFAYDYDEMGSVYVPIFGALTNAMRRDPRFMPLAQRLGLLNYWHSTGHWPDFCSEPGLPYDCKAVAAKLAGSGASASGH